jgi:hypothetical protein
MNYIDFSIARAWPPQPYPANSGKITHATAP